MPLYVTMCSSNLKHITLRQLLVCIFNLVLVLIGRERLDKKDKLKINF